MDDSVRETRRQIDEIDASISILLVERLRRSSALIEAKRAAGVEIFDPDREEIVLSNYEQGGPRQIALAILRVSKGVDRG